ncbi:MAG: dependent oxidoreductase, partial [Verrucomicrobia bacterium]|nr:dependent oxidoreductase [Verrucomicrobiota bacterium]
LARYLDELDKIKGGAPTATAAIALGKMPPALRERLKRPWDINDVLQPRLGLLPNGKNDTNNEGAFSTDYIGASHDYPDADYATRARIWQAHIDYDQGLLYFLQNDPQVPNPLHEALATWGLCKDEFVDNGNWPYQLYVREGRRMTGEYVMRQQDVQTEITKPDPIGMGSYGIDIHHIQRIVGGDGFVQNEGDEPGRTTPYQIPYRALLPKRDQARNLLVPVCLSASHVAYASLRMEPVYMTTGQAAGVAAKLAIDAGISVQDVDYTALVAKLDAQRAVTAFAVASVLPGVPDRNGIIVHEVQSPRQAGPTEIRMLLPEHTGSDRLPVIYVLPVETGTKTDLGDPLLEIKRLNLQNICNVIFVEPTFSATPWYADNPNDPKVRQETYLLKDVIPFVDRRYPTRARPDGRLLVGFSKSGWGAWTLMLRHPATFGRAAAWDAPMMLDHYSAWGSAPIYGSQENFEQYRITNLLRSNVAELRASTRSPRLILTGYAVFQDHHEQVHALMKELGVPHVFRNGPRLKHDWCSGWLEESISLLLAPGDLGK